MILFLLMIAGFVKLAVYGCASLFSKVVRRAKV